MEEVGTAMGFQISYCIRQEVLVFPFPAKMVAS